MTSLQSQVAVTMLAIACVVPVDVLAEWPADPLVNLPICTASGDQKDPTIAPDGAGGAFVAWRDARGGVDDPDIYVHHVLSGGELATAWPNDGLLVSNVANVQEDPRIVSDGAGGAIVIWGDDRDEVTGTDVYAHHVLSAGVIDPAWPSNGTRLCGAPNAQVNVSVISDGTGGAIAAWQDPRSGTDLDIYVQHVLANGEIDPAWPVDGRALCTAAGNQVIPALVADGVGGAFVAWYDERFDAVTDDDLFAHRVLASGEADPAWPVDGLAVCIANNRQISPDIVSDGLGGAIISWSDSRDGDVGIYAQRILPTGSTDPSWPVNGAALCTAEGFKGDPKAVSDGQGGAIVTWIDERGGTFSPDIYAQRILPAGVVDPLWPVDGRALCLAAGRQSAPEIVSDAASGALVTWMDERNGTNNSDVYAQHLLSTGAVDPTWPLNGRALSSASDRQALPVIVTDLAGGAIVAWQDSRGGTERDIYAQRVQSNGELGGNTLGACCLVSGQCVQVAESDCLGSWGGDYLPCEPNPCAQPIGACCYPDGSCFAVVEEDCGGAFEGPFTMCDPSPCPPASGACCLVGFCIALTPDECAGFGGTYQGHGVICTPTHCETSGVDELTQTAMLAPRSFPNPSTGGMRITFFVPSPGHASLRIFDASGRAIRTLLENEHAPGPVSVDWDGGDDSGREVPSGVYLVGVETSAEIRTWRITLTR